MLSDKQLKAVGLLFKHTEEEVTRRLRISRNKLEEWKRDPDFVQALCERVADNRREARRILSQICLQACRELEALINSDDERNKPKAIIEVLKASGLFKELEAGEGDPVGDLLRSLADEEEDFEPGEAD